MVRKVGIKSKDLVGYTDADAVAAMGAKADANPLHHDRYTDAEVNALIAAALATVLPDYVHTALCLPAYTNSSGTWAVLNNAAIYAFGSIYNSTHNNGDYLEWEVWLPAGNYTCLAYGVSRADAGITDFYVEGVEEGSKDWYSASVTPASVTFTFTVAATGAQTIKMILDGKNGSSSNHYVNIQRITIGRTS